MSSRLMTMKFMQRGEILNSPASDSGSPMTPKTDDEEGSAAKRRKLSRASAPNTPNTPAAPLYDQKALQAAIAEEETKRLAAIEKRAAELGDSHWVLDTVSASSKSGPHRSLNIVQVGFAQIDSSGTSEENTDSPGTGSQPAPAPFRQFNMKKAKVCFYFGERIYGTMVELNVYRPSRKTRAIVAQTPVTMIPTRHPLRSERRSRTVVGGTLLARQFASEHDLASRHRREYPKAGRKRST